MGLRGKLSLAKLTFGLEPVRLTSEDHKVIIQQRLVRARDSATALLPRGRHMARVEDGDHRIVEHWQ